MDIAARKLLAVVGPTASGKTALSIALANRIAGTGFEAMNADSRQVYRHMDIGTAKPTPTEQAALPHHLVDLISPDEPFSLARWLELANEAMESIWGRGYVPIVVGGTGQYVWALLEGWRVPKVPPDAAFRAQREALPAEELLAELRKIDPQAEQFVQPQNSRRIIRALEVSYATGKPFSYWRTRASPSFEWLAVGPRISRDELYARIDVRVDEMFEAGFVEEVRRLRDMGYSCGLPSLSSIGYGEVCRHIDGEMTLQEAVYRTKVGTHRLARHQNAWFKASDDRIRWVDSVDAAIDAVSDYLEV